jgi:hypothetical protein
MVNNSRSNTKTKSGGVDDRSASDGGEAGGVGLWSDKCLSPIILVGEVGGERLRASRDQSHLSQLKTKDLVSTVRNFSSGQKARRVDLYKWHFIDLSRCHYLFNLAASSFRGANMSAFGGTCNYVTHMTRGGRERIPHKHKKDVSR